jgi:hypothetical protein
MAIRTNLHSRHSYKYLKSGGVKPIAETQCCITGINSHAECVLNGADRYLINGRVLESASQSVRSQPALNASPVEARHSLRNDHHCRTHSCPGTNERSRYNLPAMPTQRNSYKLK